MSIERTRQNMTSSQRNVAFAILGATMERETITTKVIRRYYALTGTGVGEANLYRILDFFNFSGLTDKSAVVGDDGQARVCYVATAEGLGKFGIGYMRGLSNEYWDDVRGFQHEANTPLGLFALDCAVGNITPASTNEPPEQLPPPDARPEPTE